MLDLHQIPGLYPIFKFLVAPMMAQKWIALRGHGRCDVDQRAVVEFQNRVCDETPSNCSTESRARVASGGVG